MWATSWTSVPQPRFVPSAPMLEMPCSPAWAPRVAMGQLPIEADSGHQTCLSRLPAIRQSSPVLRAGSSQAGVGQQLVLAEHGLKGHGRRHCSMAFWSRLPCGHDVGSSGALGVALTPAPCKFMVSQAPHVLAQNRQHCQQ